MFFTGFLRKILSLRFALSVMALSALTGELAMGSPGLRSSKATFEITGPVSILVTGFEPFAGRAENLSFEIAKRLGRSELLARAGIDVTVCELPVVYDRAANIAEMCLNWMLAAGKIPTFVFSLGEGDCGIRIETLAHNLDDTPSLADNEGQFRSNQKILGQYQKNAAIGFQFPVQELYCAIPTYARARFRVSNSMGNFVCNNTAYHLTHRLARHIPFAFMHVPHRGCGPLSHPTQNAAWIAQLLKASVEASADSARASLPLPHPGNRLRIPVTSIELQETREALRKNPEAPACYEDFLNELEFAH